MTEAITNATAAQLESTIETWRDRFTALDAETAHQKPAPDRWSISEVVGHLIDSACNNHQRFVRAQFCDALEFPKYDQNEWVAAGGYQRGDWVSLVQLWYHYNRQIAALMRGVPESQLATPCKIGSGGSCTLEFLITDYLDHLNHHLKILAERIDAMNSGLVWAVESNQ